MNVMNRVTLATLKRSKTRTIVTIIGIILSTAMIAAVTTFISSFQNFLINYTKADTGDWHAVLYNADLDTIEGISQNREVQEVAVTKGIGYALLEGGLNEYKPYLYVLGFDEKAFEMLPVHLKSGRLPQNENEVVVPYHVFTNGGVQYKVGDTIELDIGYRVLDDGTVLGQKDYYRHEEDGASEKLVVTGTRTYKVVGICERPPFAIEEYSAPGYTLITVLDKSKLGENDTANVYIKLKNPRRVYDIYDSLGMDKLQYKDYEYNDDLLRFMGISQNDNFTAVLYSLAAILIALIMAGSVSFIYNSFSISVSERKKYFGLLSSIGATAQQLKHSVFFEALVLAAIGIPLGILSGIAGIGVTLHLLRDMFASIMSLGDRVSMTLSVSIPSVITAVVLALVTILISAYIPAWRSGKISPIDAIRQTTDIKLTARQVRTWRLTRKLFGMEGDLALKNLKRSRKRYRSTVISLFMSIVLFVSASSFSMYLMDSVSNVYQDVDYDLYYFTNERGDLKDSTIKVYRDIVLLDSIEQGSIVRELYAFTDIPKEYLNQSFYDEMIDNGFIPHGEEAPINVILYSVDRDTFKYYVRQLGLDESLFTNPDSPAGIAIDYQHYYDDQQKRFINSSIFSSKKPESIALTVVHQEDGERQLKEDIQLVVFANEAPFGVPDYASSFNSILVVVSDEIRKAIFDGDEKIWGPANMYFAAVDPFEAEQDIMDILVDAGLPTHNLLNIAGYIQNSRNIVTIISVFSYGFIILISLISIANVFNTISTNINLRRIEFAMLKSVGMTDSSFNRMLNYECIFYGLKALLYGLPVSVLITYLIHISIRQGVEMPFRLPTGSIVVSVLSVFFVVFASMVYSMRKIRHENIMDAIKSESV
ncbi:ABC transporter permease [Caldicoprobacter faecalis]|uniref:Putative ABC transport system permease protein n=1 Tax=Caldicoprobacter faecalis TaxID=937334 RepID=A0A1I5TBV8_9FIRM|nr:ABC transporter permease [Caldicoprobacter faecalis]SFP80533.1 putative ABC transport system permease protein [Caldicoprobacter faecalis]